MCTALKKSNKKYIWMETKRAFEKIKLGYTGSCKTLNFRIFLKDISRLDVKEKILQIPGTH